MSDCAPLAMDRRRFLVGGAAFGVVAAIPWARSGPAEALRGQWQPPIRPRSDWDEGHGPTAPIEAEDPRFLLVHHTASPGNDYGAEEVPRLLRSMYWYHTGQDKLWPDIAYNFLVDRYGTIWEGRTGSLAGPVRGSATGGNQGFSQLCCFIGDLSEADPTPEAVAAMVNLLAWLSVQREIDVSVGATTAFTSRGSNKWPEGTELTTPTIAAHRDMSQTTCPGEKGAAFVSDVLPALVLTKVQEVGASEAGSPTSDSPATSIPTTIAATSTTVDPRRPQSWNEPTSIPTAAPPFEDQYEAAAPLSPTKDDSSGLPIWIPVAAVAGAAAAFQVTTMTRKNRGTTKSQDSS